MQPDRRPEVADLPPENMEEEAQSVGAVLLGRGEGNLFHLNAPCVESREKAKEEAERAERARKGKGVMGESSKWADKIMGPDNDFCSDSCNVVGQGSPFVGSPIHKEGSHDADSFTGPPKAHVTARPNVPKQLRVEGISGKGKEGETMVELEVGKEAGRGGDDLNVGEKGKRGGSTGKSRSKASTASVPPGFKRVEKGKLRAGSGAAYPFGRLQRGAFKHLKRTTSGSGSVKSLSSVSLKRSLSLNEMPSSAFEALARDMGISQPLNDEQIAYLKYLERKRATS